MAELLLLVTGAGASRNLGIGEEKMPLMADWSNALCDALDAEQRGLAQACRLERGMDGPTFEANLGLLLKFGQSMTLVKDYASLGADDFLNERPAIRNARELIFARLTVVKRAIDTTLYDQFGLAKVDDEKAVEAFDAVLGHSGRKELVFATTNYDRAGESALAALDFNLDTGFRGSPGRTPRLDPGGLIANRRDKTPVIHLHGAVGWYERDGVVEDHYADKPYNDSLGAPVVLYPDPDKDPTKDAAVSELWTEFDLAVDEAEVILVIGHSLHDPVLVNSLRGASTQKRVVISYFSKDDKQRIEREIPKAEPVHMDFGPKVKVLDSLRKALT